MFQLHMETGCSVGKSHTSLCSVISSSFHLNLCVLYCYNNNFLEKGLRSQLQAANDQVFLCPSCSAVDQFFAEAALPDAVALSTNNGLNELCVLYCLMIHLKYGTFAFLMKFHT